MKLWRYVLLLLTFSTALVFGAAAGPSRSASPDATPTPPSASQPWTDASAPD